MVPFLILQAKSETSFCMSQVVLVALPGVNLEAVQREVDAQCDALPRGDVARRALSHSCVVRVDSQVRPPAPRCTYRPGPIPSGPWSVSASRSSYLVGISCRESGLGI